MTHELIYNDEITQSLSKAVYHANANLRNALGLLRMVIEQEMWRKRMVAVTGKVIEFEKFEDYVAAQPPEGLGASITTLKRLCSSDLALIALVDQVLSGKDEATRKRGDNKPHKAKRHPSTDNGVEKTDITGHPLRVIKRLEREGRYDWAQKIRDGTISAYKVEKELDLRPSLKKPRHQTRTKQKKIQPDTEATNLVED